MSKVDTGEKLRESSNVQRRDLTPAVTRLRTSVASKLLFTDSCWSECAANHEAHLKSGRRDGTTGVSFPAHHVLSALPSAPSPVGTRRMRKYSRRIGAHLGWCFS